MDSPTPAARVKGVRAALAGGRPEEAASLAAEVEALEPPAGPRLRAVNLHLGATALALAGRWAEAEDWARRGLRVAIRQAREASLVGPLLGLLGERALAAGRFERALVCFGHARRWFERGGDANGVAVARGNLALTMLRLGRRDQARGELLRAATGFTAVGNLREAARTRVILSDLLRENGDLDEARRALAEVARVAEEHRFADLAVEAGMRLGMARELLEAQFTQAEAWLLAADRIYSEAAD